MNYTPSVTSILLVLGATAAGDPPIHLASDNTEIVTFVSPADDDMIALSNFAKEIESYQFLEEDEDSFPSSVEAIARAKALLNHIYTAGQLPTYVIPTRSGGIGLEYKSNGAKVYYRIDLDLSMRYTVFNHEDKVVQKQMFANAETAPTPSQLA